MRDVYTVTRDFLDADSRYRCAIADSTSTPEEIGSLNSSRRTWLKCLTKILDEHEVVEDAPTGKAANAYFEDAADDEAGDRKAHRPRGLAGSVDIQNETRRSHSSRLNSIEADIQTIKGQLPPVSDYVVPPADGGPTDEDQGMPDGTGSNRVR